MSDSFEDLPADAQIDPIPDGFEALPADATLEPAQGARMDPTAYRTKVAQLIQAGNRKALDDFLRSQGVDPAQTTGIDEAMAAAKQGRAIGVHVTDGQTTANAGAETAGQAFYRGVGDLAEGVGDVLGIVGNPLNMGINAIAGTDLSTDLGATFRDWTGAPDAVTSGEKTLGAIAQGGAGALATAGMGALASGARGGVGYVAQQLAANPAKDLAAGVTGAIGAEYGGDVGEALGGNGGRVAGSIVGGLVGGGAGLSAARRIEQSAMKLTQRVPAEVALAADGTLTEDGREIAARLGVPEDEVVRAYARARNIGNRPRDLQARREAFRNRPADADPVSLPEQSQVAPVETPNLPARTAAIEQGIQDRLTSGAPVAPRSLMDEANDEGVRLTRGQAEQNFEVQNDENGLRVSATKEGEQARQFFQGQQRQIATAVERLRARFGPDAGNAADRGQQVQNAVRELRDAGAEGVRQLYREAESLGGEGLRLETQGIRDAATDVLIDEAVPETVKKAVSQELARYGLIGEAQPTNEAGITRVVLDDGSSVSFRGQPKELTASNAEELRKAVNRLYLSDPTRASQSIKPAIDDALESALERAATQGEGQIGEAYRAARQGFRTQQQTFKAKDIIDNLTAAKKGTDTPVLLPERAIAQVIGAGKDGVTNLRKVRALLMSSSTPSARQAWAAIQHQSLADIFDKAFSRNVNLGSGQVGDVISGAKLNSAIDAFGVDKLRTVLSPEDFNGLMKLRRVIGAATIPISGTTNPSGTATKLINYMKAGTLRFAGAIPGLGTVANAVAGAAAKGKEIAATRKTLEGITNYTGPESSRRIDQQARDFVREYIESGKSGRFVPASVNLTATQGRGKQND